MIKNYLTKIMQINKKIEFNNVKLYQMKMKLLMF